MGENKATFSQLSEQSSVLDIPSSYDIKQTILQKHDYNGGINDISSCSVLASLSSASGSVGYNSMDSQENTNETSADYWTKSGVKTINDNSVSSYHLNENLFQPSNCSFSTKTLDTGDEQLSESDISIRKSLDMFYHVYCHRNLPNEDACSKTVLEHVSSRIADIAIKKGHKYALRSFQMAHIILNRDGCEVFKAHSKSARFSPLAEPASIFEKEKTIPGLSKDVLHFLLKQRKKS